MSYLTYAVDADGVALITLDNLQETMNTVSPGFIDAFVEAIDKVASDPAVKGAVVSSAKPGFMAGADLKHILAQLETGFTTKAAVEFSRRPSMDVHRRLETCGKPFAAAINGLALGGGYELALACHRRFLADDPKAVVGLPEVTVGLLPGSGGTQRLPRLIGVEPALKVLLDGAPHKPADALKLGMVDEVVPADRLVDAARAWVLSGPSPVKPWDEKGYKGEGAGGLLNPRLATLTMMQAPLIAAKTHRNYPAPICILSAVFEGVQAPFDVGLRIETKYFAKLLLDPVARNLIRTTFVNKGLAEKGARRPAGQPSSKVSKVGVLGAGMMGAGIAYVSALAGIEVVLIDTTQVLADKGKAYGAGLLAKAVERGQRTREAADAILARITATTDFTALKGVDLVVEAVFEDTAVKAEATRRAQAVIGDEAVFASNTSTLPIGGLAQAFNRPADFIGLHFFSPVDRMPLVEVILGQQTSDATLARALDFVAQLKKTPIVVHDSRGFYTSRVFQTFIHEGAAMLGEGVAPALIENGAKLAGMPVGPLALLDEVTMDLPLKIVDQSIDEVGPSYVVPPGAPVMRRMKDELNRSSRKAGGGFYDYPEGGKKALWSGLADAFPASKDQPEVQELKTRMLYIQALETARCLEEGVLTHPADADLGAVLGWGFPTYTGGTLSLIDTVGVDGFVRECDRLAQAYGPRFQPTPGLRARAARGQRFYA